MKSYAQIVLALLSVGALSAQAALPEWVGGRLLQNDYYGVNRPDENDFLQASATLWLSLNPEITENWSWRSTLAGTVFFRSLEHGEHAALDGNVREAYAMRSVPGFELRVGQQINPWGKSDGVNPTDFLSGKDYTWFNPDDEVKRRGAPGILVSLTPAQGASPWNLTLVGNAWAAQSRMLVPTAALAAGVTVSEDDRTDRLEARNFEGAAKLSYLGAAIDASLSYFAGRSRFGQFYSDGAGLRIHHPKLHALGGDFSFTSGSYVFRGESAYCFLGDGKKGREGAGLSEPHHWDTVFGAERPVGDDFRAQIQVLHRYHPSYADPDVYQNPNPLLQAFERAVGKGNAIMQNYKDRRRVGATFRFSYVPEAGDYAADFFMIGNFIGRDYVMRPQVSYRGIENLNFMLGADLYGGSRDQPLGSLQDFNAVFFEAKRVF